MVAPLHPWTWPAKTWQRINIDFAGPFQGRMFFITVDAHSWWPEVIEMTSTTATATIQELRRLFAAYGLPQQIASNNGPGHDDVSALPAWKPCCLQHWNEASLT